MSGSGKVSSTPFEIARAITEQLSARLRAADISVERTLKQLRRHAFFDPGCLWDHGRLREVEELTEEQRAPIAGQEIIIKNAAGGDGHTDTVLKRVAADARKRIADAR